MYKLSPLAPASSHPAVDSANTATTDFGRQTSKGATNSSDEVVVRVVELVFVSLFNRVCNFCKVDLVAQEATDAAETLDELRALLGSTRWDDDDMRGQYTISVGVWRASERASR